MLWQTMSGCLSISDLKESLVLLVSNDLVLLNLKDLFAPTVKYTSRSLRTFISRNQILKLHM